MYSRSPNLPYKSGPPRACPCSSSSPSLDGAYATNARCLSLAHESVFNSSAAFSAPTLSPGVPTGSSNPMCSRRMSGSAPPGVLHLVCHCGHRPGGGGGSISPDRHPPSASPSKSLLSKQTSRMPASLLGYATVACLDLTPASTALPSFLTVILQVGGAWLSCCYTPLDICKLVGYVINVQTKHTV